MRAVVGGKNAWRSICHIIGGDALDFGSEEAFGAARAFVFDLFAVAETSKSFAVDDGEVDEDIFARWANDKAKAFFGVKPLNQTDWHTTPQMWAPTAASGPLFSAKLGTGRTATHVWA
jgi:hypothetical protein